MNSKSQLAPPASCSPSGRNKSVEIVVISVPTATKRRSNIRSMFDGVRLSWRFFDAHTSLQHSRLSYDPREIKRRFGRTLSVPEIAVGSSHVAVLTEFLQRDSTDYVLVLEDDVIFDTDFPLDKLSALCADKGIDYIRLFGKHYAKAIRIGFFFDRSIIRYETSPAGAQAYMMSKNGARLFVEKFRSIDATVDLAMDSFWKLGMPVYSIFPYPIIERYSPTSIPIPPGTSELSKIDRTIWNYNRVITKAKKIRANMMLSAKDRIMQRESAKFRQIYDQDE
jgi:glycosyl transferase family 25